jgi:ubiquinone/menaquinone biosynthesis C-methylase UbiE
MSSSAQHINEQQAAKAFNNQSAKFDTIYNDDTIIQYKRQRVRQHVQQYISPNSNVLELNSGTGEDAVWFAQNGHTVHATDIATGMQQQLQQKVNSKELQHLITTELISFTRLKHLQQQKKYDYIFSNFAGLNCTGDLDTVLQSFSNLLNEGGKITMVILPRFCLWEFLLLFKGQFKTAFRRLFSSKGVTAHVEGAYFKCYYYTPSFIIQQLKKDFELLSIEGLCTLVPPSYIEGFAQKHSRWYHFLKNKEDKWKGKWPWKLIGDYYIISFKKKAIG